MRPISSIGYQSSRRKRGPTIVAALLLLLFNSSGRTANGQAPVRSEQVSREAQRSIANWLECSGCPPTRMLNLVGIEKQGGERGAVAKVLGAALCEGPPRAVTARIVRDLTLSEQELLEYAARHPEAVPLTGAAEGQASFVQVFIRNYRTSYRIRAAQALGASSGEAAGEELRKCRDIAGNPEEVDRAIDDAMRKRAEAPK